jgi:hypothetical protein
MVGQYTIGDGRGRVQQQATRFMQAKPGKKKGEMPWAAKSQGGHKIDHEKQANEIERRVSLDPTLLLHSFFLCCDGPSVGFPGLCSRGGLKFWAVSSSFWFAFFLAPTNFGACLGAFDSS